MRLIFYPFYLLYYHGWRYILCRRLFFYSQDQAQLGKEQLDLSWNGEKLSLQKIGEGRYEVVEGRHKGKEVLFGQAIYRRL